MEAQRDAENLPGGGSIHEANICIVVILYFCKQDFLQVQQSGDQPRPPSTWSLQHPSVEQTNIELTDTWCSVIGKHFEECDVYLCQIIQDPSIQQKKNLKNTFFKHLKGHIK